MASSQKGFLDRLKSGEKVLIAEGYLFEFERRGYLKAGPFVPEVVLEHPEMVKQLHEEFVHAGTDIVQAFTYYATREKLRLIGREAELEEMNRKALRIAKEVADRTGTLMAGNLCNTTVYSATDTHTHAPARAMMKEQTEWAVQEGAEFIIAETVADYGEAQMALDVIQQYGNGLPSVITFAPNMGMKTKDGYNLSEAIRLLMDKGATVAGINCSTGPAATCKILRSLRKDIPSHPTGYLGAVPVPYRTTDTEEMLFLRVPETGKRAFPRSLDYFYCSDDEIINFGKTCTELGVPYMGLCCGNSSRYFRYLAESVGRSPPASNYSPNMELHWIFGEHESFVPSNTEMRETRWIPKAK